MVDPVSSEQNICYCGNYGGGMHTRSARCPGGELRTPQGEPALTSPRELPGTREPVVTAPKGNAGESPASTSSKQSLRELVREAIDYIGSWEYDDIRGWRQRAEDAISADETTSAQAQYDGIFAVIYGKRPEAMTIEERHGDGWRDANRKTLDILRLTMPPEEPSPERSSSFREVAVKQVLAAIEAWNKQDGRMCDHDYDLMNDARQELQWILEDHQRAVRHENGTGDI